MTYPRPKHRNRRPGFTLVELLVVIAIMVVLMSLVLAAVVHALKSGKKSRLQADMQTISLGLEAYRDNFTDYPQFPSTISSPSGQWDLSPQRGAELLCRALVGPGPGLRSTGSSGLDNSGADGAGDPTNPQLPGPGFRTRVGVDPVTGNQVAQGKVWGPYLSPDKFRILTLSTIPGLSAVTTLANPNKYPDATAVMLDSENHVILYFPANTTSPTLTATNGFEINTAPIAGTPLSPLPLYNFFDNATVPSDPTGSQPFAPTTNTPSWFNDFAKILGDTAATPAMQIQTGETPSYTGPYILWMAGEDGMYGFDKKPNIAGGTDFSGTGRTDDITNFDIPAQLRK